MNESWRTVELYPRYEVSNLERVKSLRDGRILKPGVNTHGYHVVAFSVGGKRSTKTVHRLVATAFIVPDPQRPHINHVDGNKLNNRVENLEWCSNHENLAHAYGLGLENGGERWMVGVRKSGRRWRADVKTHRSRAYIGSFDSPEEAFAARESFLKLKKAGE